MIGKMAAATAAVLVAAAVVSLLPDLKRYIEMREL